VVTDTVAVAHALRVAVRLFESVDETVRVGFSPAREGVACRESVNVPLGERVEVKVVLVVAAGEGEAGPVALALGEGDRERVAVGERVSVREAVLVGDM
jgi:hypothetical protein